MAKIEEASRKKDELNNEFIEQTKEALLAKMEHTEGKREAIITDLKEKLKVRICSSSRHINGFTQYIKVF